MNPLPQTLIDQLYHSDASERQQAVLALAALDHPDRLSLLLDALRVERDPFIREDLTYVITRMGDAAVPHLIALLSDEQPAVRNQAAHVLGKIGHSDAVASLIGVLEDESPDVIAKAAFALQQIGDASAVPALVRTLNHPDQEVQTMLVGTLEHFGKVAIDALASAATSESWEVRERAAEILGNIGDESAIPLLTGLLQDSDWRVRFACVNALGQIGGDEASAALREAVSDTDIRVQKLARHLLGRAAQH